MTIGEAVKQCSRMKPSQYGKEDMIRWLSQLDGQIYTEILRTHEGAPALPFQGYDDQTPEDTVLLAVYPYDRLYSYYLGAMVDYANAEYARYNNGMLQFNQAFQEYARWYNRTHRNQEVCIRLQEESPCSFRP